MRLIRKMTKSKVKDLNAKIASLLVCPKCRGELVRKEKGLACGSCGLIYPVNDGVAIMLTSRAKKLR
jgi:hypothetical protein